MAEDDAQKKGKGKARIEEGEPSMISRNRAPFMSYIVLMLSLKADCYNSQR